MGRAISLREDFDSRQLRRLARQSTGSNQTRRLLALSVIYDGGSRSEAAVVGGVGLQVIRDRVLRFNAEGPAGLVDRKSTGAPPKLNAAHLWRPLLNAAHVHQWTALYAGVWKTWCAGYGKSTGSV